MNSTLNLTATVKHTTNSQATLVPYRERLAQMNSPHYL